MLFIAIDCVTNGVVRTLNCTTLYARNGRNQTGVTNDRVAAKQKSTLRAKGGPHPIGTALWKSRLKTMATLVRACIDEPAQKIGQIHWIVDLAH